MLKGKENIVFILFLSVGLILLFYLVYNVLSTFTDYRELVRMFMVLILPLPVALFFAYVASSGKKQEKKISRKDIIISILIFIGTTLMILLAISRFDKISNVIFRELRILPLFLNTVVTFAYSINYLLIKNLRLSGVLSGLLLGFAIYFFI
ncbi:MAG: hypothetical protein JW894_16510 [Bacteroidales bacterium]|nr:hypothetical protein [Bacteroidales bacterium]